MALSSDLMSQFAKNVVGNEKQKTETNVYGSVKMVGDEVYVRLDGADQDRLIPMKTTAEVKDGERVTVRIKNHDATITGNISSPAARVGTVEEINGKLNIAIGRLEANEAVINNLDATYATIENLSTLNATIGNLDAKIVKVEELAADHVTVGQLESEYISAESIESAYANIDFANIGEAAFRRLFVDSGIMQNLEVNGVKVTGEIVGVTIIGDVIKGGTVIADKLVLRDSETGLLYKLNTIGEEITSEQIDQNEYNSLNGSIITAKTITAEKVSVSDLVAFDATIGGFNITHESLYSEVKESVHNTTRGVYMDRYGQLAIGDAGNFIKYYQDEDGSYTLDIAAKSITFGTNDESLETVIERVSEQTNELTTNLGNIEAVVSNLNNTTTELGKTSEYVKIITFEGRPCVALGEDDSDFKSLVTNTNIMFIQGSKVPTLIDTTGLVTENITVKDEFRQGNDCIFLSSCSAGYN